MSARWIRACLLVAWLALSAWFIRYEAFPDLFTRAFRGYQDLISHGVMISDSWMKILFDGTPIGYSHTKIDLNEDKVGSRYEVKNETVLNMQLMGEKQRVTMTTDAMLDAMYFLQKFRFHMYSRISSVRVEGTRSAGTTFLVRIHTGDTVQRINVDIPDDAIIYSPMTSAAVAELGPGQEMKIRTLDPLSLSTISVVIRGLPPETITLNGTEIDARVVSTEYMGMETRSWIDDEGNMLRQETPLGFIAESCQALDAMNAAYDDGRQIDGLLRSLAVPASRLIDRPRECTEMRVKITGLTEKPNSMQLESLRQTIEKIEDDGTLYMRIRSADAPTAPLTVAGAAVGKEEFLKSTPFIQADNHRLRKTAEKIVSGSTNAMEAATAILYWVSSHMVPSPSPGVPSALDVLNTLQGDCNEHTYLFVALARAAGIPATIKVGVVYHNGAFYYHAWPAVYVGEWLEMEPTFRPAQVVSDATHIAMFEGGFADQLGLVSTIRRMKIEVLSTAYAEMMPSPAPTD